MIFAARGGGRTSLLRHSVAVNVPMPSAARKSMFVDSAVVLAALSEQSLAICVCGHDADIGAPAGAGAHRLITVMPSPGGLRAPAADTFVVICYLMSDQCSNVLRLSAMSASRQLLGAVQP